MQYKNPSNPLFSVSSSQSISLEYFEDLIKLQDSELFKLAGGFKVISVPAGNIILKPESGKITVKNNSVVVVPPNNKLRIVDFEKSTCSLCWIEKSIFESIAQRVGGITPQTQFEQTALFKLEEDEKDSFQSLLRILNEESIRSECDIKLINPLIAALVYTLLQNQDNKCLKAQNPSRRNETRISRLLTLLSEHVTAQHKVCFYAEQLNLSERYLNSLCCKHLGLTLTQIIHHRLNELAILELENADKSILVISEQLGFKDPSYFSRFFKRLNGVSPTKFRIAKQDQFTVSGSEPEST